LLHATVKYLNGWSTETNSRGSRGEESMTNCTKKSEIENPAFGFWGPELFLIFSIFSIYFNFLSYAYLVKASKLSLYI
jgi:hypothetical protein